MSKPRDDRQVELFRPALEQIIDLGHSLVRLAGELELGDSGEALLIPYPGGGAFRSYAFPPSKPYHPPMRPSLSH